MRLVGWLGEGGMGLGYSCLPSVSPRPTQLSCSCLALQVFSRSNLENFLSPLKVILHLVPQFFFQGNRLFFDCLLLLPVLGPQIHLLSDNYSPLDGGVLSGHLRNRNEYLMGTVLVPSDKRPMRDQMGRSGLVPCNIYILDALVLLKHS